MSWFEWILLIILGSLYIFCLFTVCAMTFAKGRVWLGIIGIFVPFLWLIGAVLPAKEGSNYAIAEAERYRSTARTY